MSKSSSYFALITVIVLSFPTYVYVEISHIDLLYMRRMHVTTLFRESCVMSDWKAEAVLLYIYSILLSSSVLRKITITDFRKVINHSNQDCA